MTITITPSTGKASYSLTSFGKTETTLFDNLQPAKPTSVTFSAKGKVTIPNSANAKSYEVQYSTGSQSLTWNIAGTFNASTGTSTTVDISGKLVKGLAYKIRVIAINGQLRSDASLPTSAVTYTG